MAMERLFQLMKEKNASDMFFAVNSPVHIKINGNLIPINQQKLEPENIHSLLSEIASPAQMEELAATNELNMGVSVPNMGRFRLSAFKQRGTISAVFRFVPATIPVLADLQLPPVLADLIMEKRGLLLLVGSTGSGKSTTIASMLDHRNAWRPAHIHFSLFGSQFTQRLVTQMYFPTDPLFALDPIYQSIVDPAARERLKASYDHDLSVPEWAMGYRWDIVLTGSRATWMEPEEGDHA